MATRQGKPGNQGIFLFITKNKKLIDMRIPGSKIKRTRRKKTSSQGCYASGKSGKVTEYSKFKPPPRGHILSQ